MVGTVGVVDGAVGVAGVEAWHWALAGAGAEAEMVVAAVVERVPLLLQQAMPSPHQRASAPCPAKGVLLLHTGTRPGLVRRVLAVPGLVLERCQLHAHE